MGPMDGVLGRDVIVHMFDHYEERLIKVIEKKGDITDY